ncbi:MAG: DUF4440 domain-containing protein [Alphaproteobacteria bacterium]|nr:DUF4440 domain-containing protein [Alphaproteobacteria bacterium]
MRFTVGLLTTLPFVVSIAHADDRAMLVRQTQEMFDAVTAGDAKVWDKYLAPGAIYVDEAGVVNTRADLIKQITPLPKGISGNIKVNAVAFHQTGDVAILVHRDDETENYFGQTLHAEYLSTNTWQKTKDGWRLIGEQVLATLKEPPPVALAPAKLDEYAGSFHPKDGSLTYTVAHKGAKLMGTRTGRPAVELQAEATDVFFVKGQPRIRKIFQRDASGRIAGFVDRREGRDVVWLKQ